MQLIHDCDRWPSVYGEACSEEFKVELQNATGYGQRAGLKMATENNASAACRNFKQIYTLSTLCMPELQFQHANMHALIHAVFCSPKSARHMACAWKSLEMGVHPQEK